MKNKKILGPVDLNPGTAPALMFVQQLASESPLSVTLLHVIDLNIVPQQGIYEQLRAESVAALRKLANLFFGSDQVARISVRIGRPAEEIIAEATGEASDLIVLCGPKSHRARFFSRSTTEQVLESASCATLVLPHPAKTNGRVSSSRELVPADICAFPARRETVAAA